MDELLRQAKSDPQLAQLLESLPPDKLDQLMLDFHNLKAAKPRAEGELDEEGGVVITPERGYVIKTSDVHSKEKVFINICAHAIIDAPEQKDLPEDTDSVGLRVPISLGPPRPDFDKSKVSLEGRICTVFDVIVNPGVLSASKKDPVYRQLLVELSFNYIAQKHKRDLSTKYRLPKIKYKGQSIQTQRVRGKKAPQIQVVDSEVFKEPASTGPAVPLWELLVDGEKLDSELLQDSKELQLIVELPLLVSGRAISLKMSPERLELTVGKLYQLGLWLPTLVDFAQATAAFDCSSRTLRVSAPTSQAVPQAEVPVARLESVELSTHSLLFDVL
jgi:dynein assembly factor 2